VTKRRRSGEAQAALGRRAPKMDHRLEPRGGTTNECRDLLSYEAPASLTCVCGCAVEEHGNDPEYPGSTSCTQCDCIAYEANGPEEDA
jgi:hypothetical protein